MNTTAHNRKRNINLLNNKGKQRENSKGIMPVLLLFTTMLALMILLLPKEPTSRATTAFSRERSGAASESQISYYEGLRISEVMPANSSAVPDDVGAFSDYIEIWNSTTEPIDLRNVGLSDRGDKIRFIFPASILQPDGRVVVFASDTNQSYPDKAFHAKFKLSSVGETVYLFDPKANLLDTVTIPIMNTDSAYCLMADGTYQITEQYSPGYPNTEEGFLAYRNSNRVTLSSIRINEIMASAKSQVLPDEDGELCDWLELYNSSDEPYPLEQLYLSNKENKPYKWKFPNNAMIPANGYYIVFCSGKDRNPSNEMGIAHANFRISTKHDTIILSDAQGRLLDRVLIDNMPADKSYGRNVEGDFEVFDIGTPLQPNTSIGAFVSDELLRSRNQTGVYITEVMASNSDIIVAPNQDTSDYVELHNASNQIVYLKGYALSDNVNRARKWQFPSDASIMPNSYLVVFLDGKADQTAAGQYHTNFKLTRAGGETICFSNPDGVVLDKIDLPLIPTNVSYGRTKGLSGLCFYDEPTPGAANGPGFYGYAATPAFSLHGGLYDEEQLLTITVPEGTAVYYTTDGSAPTEGHTPYQGEIIRLHHTTTIRARAFQNEYQPSDIITQTYFMNVFHTLPIIAISIDPNELYNEETGIFTVGPNVDKSKRPYRNAVYSTLIDKVMIGKMPRDCHVEYYSLDNEVIINQGLEISLSGGYSIDQPQKSLKLRAKALYGAKYIDAHLFDDRAFDQYKSFTLRMGGNDGLATRLVDGLQSQLVDELDTTVIHQAWKPVVVYINGTYWGHYNLRERKDRYFIAQHEGISFEEADNMDIVMGSGSAEHGSASEYKELIAKAKTLNTATNEEDLKYLTDRVDVENCLDYYAIEMFFGNSDTGNLQVYKIKGEGQKFKWLLYDMDYGLFKSSFDSPRSYLKEKGAGERNVNNAIIVKLLENDDIRDQFLTRLGEIFQLFTTEHMIAKLDEMVALIEPEMPLHFARWAEFTDKVLSMDVPTTAEAGFRYWKERIRRLREETLRYRPPRFYDMIKKQFELSEAQMFHYFGERPPSPPGMDE